jgi:hypothetical protein
LNKFLQLINIRELSGSSKVSQKAIDGLENGGAVIAIFSGLGGAIADNHEIFWFTFGFIGASVAIYGAILNYKRNKRDQEKHDLEMKIKMRELKSLPKEAR